MKCLLFVFLMLVLGSIFYGDFASAEEKTTIRTPLKQLGLIMAVPKGWALSSDTRPGQSSTFRPASDGVVGSLSIHAKTSYSDLEGFKDEEIGATKHVMPTTVVVESSKLILDSGAEARKVVTEPNFKGLELVVTLYFIKGPGSKKFIISATGTKENSAELGPLYDAWVKSITVLSPPPGE